MRWIVIVAIVAAVTPFQALGGEYYSMVLIRDLGGDPRSNDVLGSCWDQSANDINSLGNVVGTFAVSGTRRAFLGIEEVQFGESSRGCAVDDRGYLAGALNDRGELGPLGWSTSYFLSGDDPGRAVTAMGKRLVTFAGEGWNNENQGVSEGFTVGPHRPRGRFGPAEFTTPLPMPVGRANYPSLNQSTDVRVMGAKGLEPTGHGFIVGAFLDPVSNHLHPYRVKSALGGCAPPNLGSCTAFTAFRDFSNYMPFQGDGASHEVAEDGRTVGCSVGVNPYTPFLNAFVAGTIDQPVSEVVSSIHPMDWDFAPMTPSCAFGINSSGAVVGSFGEDGFIWGDYAGMRLLNGSFGGAPFFDRTNGRPGLGWYEIVHARAINDRGVIAANAAKFDTEGVLLGFWAVKLEPRVVIASVALDRSIVSQGGHANLIITFEQPAPPVGSSPPLLLETYSVFADQRMTSAMGIAALDELAAIPGGASAMVLPIQTSVTSSEYDEELLICAYINGVRMEVPLTVRPPERDCQDGGDDDSDGYYDCEDGDCAGATCSAEYAKGVCVGGRCLDCVECGDPDCEHLPCGDGKSECVEGRCVTCREACAGGEACLGRACDLDGSGTVGICGEAGCLDCLAPGGCAIKGCVGLPCSGGFCDISGVCIPSLELNCSNGIDDNWDGLVDCADPTCNGEACGPRMVCVLGGCRNEE